MLTIDNVPLKLGKYTALNPPTTGTTKVNPEIVQFETEKLNNTPCPDHFPFDTVHASGMRVGGFVGVGVYVDVGVCVGVGVLVGVGVNVGVLVGVGVNVGVLVEVGVGVFVGVGVSVGPNNCPGPQPEINKLATKKVVVMICRLVFIGLLRYHGRIR